MVTALADRPTILLAAAFLVMLREAQQLERLVTACDGDEEAALRVYRELKRVEAGAC